MTKPRRKPQNDSKGTKGRPARRNASTGQLMASGDVLSELRQARQALFDAVVNLPFDLMEPLPSRAKVRNESAAVDVFVAKCRDWHNVAVTAFNRAACACSNPIVDDRHAIGHFPLTGLLGEPGKGDPALAERPADLHFARNYMASFENRCQREDDRLAAIAPSGRPVRDNQAVRFVLDIRRRALDFCEWLRTAIERLEGAFLPRIEIGPEVRAGVHKLTVTLAGNPTPGAATEIEANVARDLLRFHKGCGKPVAIDNADAQAGKIRKLIPQLGADTGRLIRNGDGAYSLHPAMIGRIDGRNSGIRL